MVARNIDDVKKIMRTQAYKAMREASNKVLDEMNKQTSAFYSRGKPKVYIRTGALGKTPSVTSPILINNEITFTAYLDQSHNYTTGTYSMSQVLEHAESTHFRSGILGKPKFWYTAEKNMDKIFNSTLKKYFK